MVAMYLIVAFYLATVAHFGSSIDSVLPVIRVRAGKVGIELAHEALASHISNAIDELKEVWEFDDYSSDADGSTLNMGSGEVQEMMSPTFRYDMVPPVTAHWIATFDKVVVTGNWSHSDGTEESTNPPSYCSDGMYTVSFGFNLTMDINFLSTSDGKPSVRAMKCGTSFTDWDLSFGDSAPASVQSFNVSRSEMILASMKPALCARFEKLVEDWFNASLQRFPEHAKLTEDQPMFMGMSLAEHPEVTESYLECNFNGNILWEDDVPVDAQSCDLDETNLPEWPTDANDTLLAFQLSSNVLNSITCSLHNKDFLYMDVNGENYPQYTYLLKTNCVGFCIGSLDPRIGESWPNSTVTIRLEPLKPIRFNITEEDIHYNVDGIVTASIDPSSADQSDSDPEEEIDPFFSSKASASGRFINLNVRDGRLYGTMVLDGFELGDYISEMNGLEMNNIGENAKVMFATEKEILEDQLNRIFSSGLPLPVVPAAAKYMKSPMIILQDGAVVIHVQA